MSSLHLSGIARILLVCGVLTLAPFMAPRPQSASAQAVTHHTVTWDAHSLLIDGKRLLVYSGEFHYWRLPSPELWTDRLEKMKAAGLNAVSIYFDWQYHSSAPGTYDFTGIRDVNRLLDITDKLGLYVLARVGPYMNAEADAGGLPGWLLTKPLYPRDQSWNGTAAQAQDSPLYMQYSKEWYDRIVPIIARHQVTNGGSVLMVQVENEYSQDGGLQTYMQQLIDLARADGITVPVFHNDFWFKGDWSKLVDLYGFDSYPYGFVCCHQWWDLHFHGVDTWEATFRSKLGLTTPMFVSELQGGSFDPWHGAGYGAVARTLNGDWLNVLDQSALAQGTTLMNTYMFAGGTSWGYMSEPGVYTSYDYGAPISESGVLRPAYYAAHRIGMFLGSYGATLANSDAAPAVATSSNPSVVVHSRVDSSSGQIFMFLRHGDAGAPVQTSLSVAIGAQRYSIPARTGSAITVPGHGAEILTGNVQTGPFTMLYSTSSVLTQPNTAQGSYLVLYGPKGTQGETSFIRPSSSVTVTHNRGVTVHKTNGIIRLNYSHTSSPRVITVSGTAGTLHILVTSQQSASRFWLVDGMLLSGPDLAFQADGSVKVWAAGARQTTVYGAPSDRPLQIDGRTAAEPDTLTGAVPLGRIKGADKLAVPKLTTWKFSPEAPEIQPAFDDSSWQPADHTSTTNPNVPGTSTLLADDYGFHYGYVWYRGHFTATGGESGLTIQARHSYSVFLNGTYLGGGDAPLTDPPHPYATAKQFTFPSGLVHAGSDNVISVLTESLGHDEGWIAGPAAQSPEGILSASLLDAPTPIAWRIQGDLGGEEPADATHGLLNASGLDGERQGWYLPGFDDGGWSSVSLPDNWKARQVTSPIGWYRSHFSLTVPPGASQPIGLTIPHASDKAAIWLNGWLVGRYWEQRGPQHEFYLPEGLLKRGDNVLAIAVWNRGHKGGLTSVPRLTPYRGMAEHSLLPGSSPVPESSSYWHTQGNRVVDSDNRPIRIAAVNWFGMENRFEVPAGLDRRPLASILKRVRALGFNAIRLPFSNQSIEKNPIITDHLKANPDLRGLHVLDIMDRIVAEAGKDGLRVILNDARSSAGTQPQRNGLWYNRRYPESAWIADWQMLAERYRGNPVVVGFDLRNEPHTGPPGPWTVKAYLKQGAVWGPYGGKDQAQKDWRLAAQRAGDAVLSVNPHLLIIVEGLQLYPDSSQPDGVDSYWWGGILQPARKYPVVLAVPHQLVYSPHEYGPIKYQMAWFGPHMTYKSMAAIWNKHWGFLERGPEASQTPILLGEFGTCGTSVTCVEDTGPGSQGLWFSYLVRYLKAHPQIGWAFWALNGTSHAGDEEANYILRGDWHRTRLPALVDTFRDLELPPPPE